MCVSFSWLSSVSFVGMIQLFSTSAVYLYILFRCLIKCRGQEYLRNKFLYIEFFTLCTYWQEFQKESGELRTGREPLSPRHSSSLSQSRGRKTQQLQRDPTSIQSNLSAWFIENYVYKNWLGWQLLSYSKLDGSFYCGGNLWVTCANQLKFFFTLKV